MNMTEKVGIPCSQKQYLKLNNMNRGALEEFEDIKRLVSMQDMLPPISYRFWHTGDKKMFIVKELSFSESGFPTHVNVVNRTTKEVSFKSIQEGVLIPSTNLYSVDKEEIYAGDIVICRFVTSPNKTRVVFWDNGWRVLGYTPQEFADNCEDFVKGIGNMWENPIIYENYLKELKDKFKLE